MNYRVKGQLQLPIYVNIAINYHKMVFNANPFSKRTIQRTEDNFNKLIDIDGASVKRK